MSMRPRLRRALYFVPALTIATGIFISSSISSFGPLEDMPFFKYDKLIHAIIYGLLALAILWGIEEGFCKTPRWRSVFLAALLAGVYGITDEFHQMFVPNRIACWEDVIANFTGATVAVLLARVFLGMRERTRKCGDGLPYVK